MQKTSNMKLRSASSSASTKKSNRSFHFRYLELCRSKNLTPLPDIRFKNNDTLGLEFYGDKLTVNDWLLIMEALYHDQVLQTLAIRMRKTFGMVLDHLDTEKKAKLFRQKSVIFTKFIFSGIVESISNCIKFNKNLRVLNLEGLPLNNKYVELIAKALSSNESINEISFQRSNIQDKGCEAICNTIKYLQNVEKLNLSECELTITGAEYIANMIKIQKISRYTEGWEKSLRYRDVDPETIPGLRSISVSRNPQIGDDGLSYIVEVLKEDIWIKVIDMENCGLTDRAANMILDCLEINNYINDFNVCNNVEISKFLQRSIRDQLGKQDEDQKLLEAQVELVQGPNGVVIKRKKNTTAALKEQIKSLEEQLAFEKDQRKKAEQLIEKLNKQILAYENQFENHINSNIPEGYVLVKNESIEKSLKVRRTKSEMKYVDPPTKDPKKEAKSDHEFSNENDYQLTAVHFEKNIGDTLTNQGITNRSGNSSITITNSIKEKNLNSINKPSKSNSSRNKNRKNNFENLTKIELDLLSIPTTRSDIYSSESDTLRNSEKSLKVRRTKSEMKYVDPPTKDPKKEAKSDHEFSNENDYQLTAVHFEKNIGDTLTNQGITNRSGNSSITITNSIKEKNLNSINKPSKSNSSRNKNRKNNFENLTKIELDLLSIPTTRSDIYSSESDTLRNSDTEIEPLKVFIRRTKPMPLTPMPKSSGLMTNGSGGDNTSHNGGRDYVDKSPRSLFLDLRDD